MPRRSLHFVPGGQQRMLDRALTLPADGLILDLEDAVPPDLKAATRPIVREGLGRDFGAAMGLPGVPDARGAYLDIPRYARTMCAIAASAAGVDALDTVYTDIADLDGLRRECEDGVAMGFVGKISIHPSQIAVINDVFTPSKEAVTEARELVAAFVEHAARGAYAFRFKGRMVDAPHLALAKKLIARAGG